MKTRSRGLRHGFFVSMRRGLPAASSVRSIDEAFILKQLRSVHSDHQNHATMRRRHGPSRERARDHLQADLVNQSETAWFLYAYQAPREQASGFLCPVWLCGPFMAAPTSTARSSGPPTTSSSGATLGSLNPVSFSRQTKRCPPISRRPTARLFPWTPSLTSLPPGKDRHRDP